MLKIEHYIKFLKVWNNNPEYQTAQDVADALGLTKSAVVSKAKRCKRLFKTHPALDWGNIDGVLDRKRIQKDGLVYVECDVKITKSSEVDKTKKRFIITSAQFGADVNEDFLENLKSYAEFTDAQILIMPVKYSTSLEPMSKLLDDYITYKGHFIGKHVQLNQMPILATAMNPLQGLKRYASERTQIFAHGQSAMEMVPRSNIKIPRSIMTTGSVTHPLYGFNKIGEQAEFEHKFGAVVIELDGDFFHYRHIIADAEDTFCDIVGGKAYHFVGGDKKVVTIDALDCGDWHVGDTCPMTADATYNSIVPNLKPKMILKHDFFNGTSVSHHDEKDGVLMAQKAGAGTNVLATELRMCSEELDYIRWASYGAEIVIIASNHNDHLCQYLRAGKHTKDPINDLEGGILKTAMIKTFKPAFEIAMTSRGHNDIRFMRRDEDLCLHGIKLDLHGDVGINGARGSAASFDSIGLKVMAGHVHTPMIKRGVFMLGTSTHLKLGYTKGLTSWLNTHGIIYPNGQAQLINVIGGRWYSTGENNLSLD